MLESVRDDGNTFNVLNCLKKRTRPKLIIKKNFTNIYVILKFYTFNLNPYFTLLYGFVIHVDNEGDHYAY